MLYRLVHHRLRQNLGYLGYQTIVQYDKSASTSFGLGREVHILSDSHCIRTENALGNGMCRLWCPKKVHGCIAICQRFEATPHFYARNLIGVSSPLCMFHPAALGDLGDLESKLMV